MCIIMQHMQDQLKTMLKEGILPVVTIKIDPSKSASENNIALFFDGSKNRYYVHVNSDRKLYIEQVSIPKDENDWTTHVQFTNYPTS